MSEVCRRLSEKLDRSGVRFQTTTHEPVFTSEQAARVRGTSLASGAKALVVRADSRAVMFVLPADRRLERKKVRAALGVKSFRFLDSGELLELTGLETGAVPPFGSLFGIPTYCDRALAENETINFNAGARSVSIRMTFHDYLRAENPQAGDYTDPPEPR